jgi:hypothetical protein
MKTIFDKAVVKEITERIAKLSTNSERQWGKMNIAQMLSHCSITMEVAMGLRNPPRLFIGRILGPLFKSSFYNDKPFPKNSPTDPSFVVTDAKEMNEEKERLIKLIISFSEGGPANSTRHPHAFFGSLKPEQWGLGMYKHLDHHLKQFGV